MANFVFSSFPVHEKGVILVTGASSGIGYSAAAALAGAGYRVFCGVRSKKDFERLRNGPASLTPLILDVTKPIQVDSAVQAVEAFAHENKLPIVALINNAGVSRELPLELQPMQNIEYVYGVNTFGLLRMTKAFIPLVRESKGRIINIGSVAGLLATAGASTYAGTKHALEGISDALRRELYHADVSVSLVEPAFVKSKIFEKSMKQHDPVAKLSKEEYDLYSVHFRNRAMIGEANVVNASPTSVTDKAILHAVTSQRPFTRYVVANVQGIPAEILTKAFWLLPDRLTDFILYQSTKGASAVSLFGGVIGVLSALLYAIIHSLQAVNALLTY